MNKGGQPVYSLFTREQPHRPEWVKRTWTILDYAIRPHKVSEVNLWRAVLIQAIDDATVEPVKWDRYRAIEAREARDFFKTSRYHFHCDMALLEPAFVDRIYNECLDSSGVTDEFILEIIKGHSRAITKGDNEDKLIRNN